MKKEPTPEQKEAKKIYMKEYREKNKEKIKLQKKNWRLNNSDKVKEHDKTYRLKNKEVKNLRDRLYSKKNSKQISLKNKIARQTKRYKENRKRYHKTRYLNDVLYALSIKVSSSIKNSFRNKNIPKSNKSAEILGCSFEDFKQYLESKFESWMNWDNRGLYNGTPNYGWDIDHIIPISSAEIEEDIIKLNHYTNLQPLCSYVNRDIKKDKILSEEENDKDEANSFEECLEIQNAALGLQVK